MSHFTIKIVDDMNVLLTPGNYFAPKKCQQLIITVVFVGGVHSYIVITLSGIDYSSDWSYIFI